MRYFYLLTVLCKIGGAVASIKKYVGKEELLMPYRTMALPSLCLAMSRMIVLGVGNAPIALSRRYI